ncbi:MAG: CCA tRNA nucleotidyltransferase [Gemmatimonadetes bacterium]|nr:CCA tRNA nucleotidyltransferase [Gemmatimonadota bacterium]
MTLLQAPPEVLEIAEVLERAGFEAWCVGGAVRDALLGHPHLDWDLATSARPEQVRRLFQRTVPVGIEHGTIGVLDRLGRLHEVTTFRRDVKTDGRHAEVEFGVSLDDDLARRDFTINAMAWSPRLAELRDPFGGRADLAARVLRAVGDAEARMREDRLRALRAIRFAARFGFRIEPATWEAILVSARDLKRLSAERVRQELEKTLEQVARPSEALARWRMAGIADAVVPALAEVSELALRSLDHLARPGLAGRPQRKLNRLSALFCELGRTRASGALKALRSSNSDAAWVGDLAERWTALGVPMASALQAGRVDDAVARRWVATLGRLRVGGFMRIASARWAAARALGQEAPSPRAVLALHRQLARIAFHGVVELADLAIDGGDLIEHHIASGPALGKLLAGLLDWVLEDPSRNRVDVLLAEARRRVASAT